MRSGWMGLIAFTFIFSSNICYGAFELTPIIATVTPSGPGSTTSFTIANSDDTKTPVQITIYRREPDHMGKEEYTTNKDSGESFQVFPSQVILNPKEKRTVRVTYVGDPKIKRELAFRIIAEEFPINVTDPAKIKKKAVASIAIASRYVGSLYVTPPGAKGELTAEAQLKTSKSGNEMILTLDNQGSSHVVLKRPKFKILAANKEHDLPADSVREIGVQNILAGRARKFTIPWPDQIPAGPVKVSVSVETE